MHGVRALVVMGVSGSGKTTIGRRIAEVLGWEFLDADAFHSHANVQKMASGQPLTEADRAPWLKALRDALAERIDGDGGVVLACSALRRSHRDVLRQAGPEVRFLYLRADPQLVRERVAERSSHFFPPELVGSQFASLEEPRPSDEADVAVMEADAQLDDITPERMEEMLGGLESAGKR